MDSREAEARSLPAGERSATAARSFPWQWPAVATGALAAGALLPQMPLRDAATLHPIADVALDVPPAYVALAPFCNALDALTLLGARQQVALISTVVLAVVAWRTLRAVRRRPRRLLRELGVTVGALVVGVLGLYAACTLVPRPMVALRAEDPDVVVVDFHSHTNFSHDGRPGFTAERNRDWHRAGGWDVAYVSDHATPEGGWALPANPRLAGDDTTLLPAVELRSKGTHLVVLGLTPEEGARLRLDRRRAPTMDGPRHAAILTIPTNLVRGPALQHPRVGPLVGIELSDGDPRGIDQEQSDRAVVLDIAERRNLALVAGSNNHGWSYTAVAWSLLRIPGWRDLTPDALGRRIEALLENEGRHAVRVVERSGVDGDSTPMGLAATAPLVAWQILATRTPAERLSWVVWAWGLALASWYSRRAQRVMDQ